MEYQNSMTGTKTGLLNITICKYCQFSPLHCTLCSPAVRQLCYNVIMLQSVFDKETDMSGVGRCEGWKKKTHQIYKKTLFRPTANKKFSWFMGNLLFQISKLWYFISGQAEWGLSPKVETGCSFSWCLCCWRHLWCLPVQGVSRRIESAAEKALSAK